MYSMKNLTTILTLAALAACSNNTTTDEVRNDIPEGPTFGPSNDSLSSPVYDVGASVTSQIGGNVISEDMVLDGPFWTGDIVLPPNSTTRIVLDAETFVTEEGIDLELALEPVLTGDYLVTYEFPFIGGTSVENWFALRPDSFRAWAGTTSVGITRDSIAPFIDYSFPTDGTYLTDITPGTGGNDAIVETEENNFTRATVVILISNLEDGYLDLRATASATEAP